MAIDIDVRNDKFPYLARQIQGNVAKAFGLGIDHVYETDQEFLYFLSNFSIDNLDGKWLDMLGVILGMPRPYSTISDLDNFFEFDTTNFSLDPKNHGLSTSIPIIIDGVAYDRSVGGVLDSLYSSDEQIPVDDNIYKMYLKATSLLKKSHSIIDISNVLELFMDSTRYAILFRNATGYVNDIQIILSSTSAGYKNALQIAFNKIFTIPPYVLVTVALDFDNVYTIPVIESIIEDVTGEDSRYTVVFSFENKKAVFTITLDSSLAQYENEIRIALESHFAGANDVVIVIEVTGTNLQSGNKDASDCFGYSAFANGVFERSNTTQEENYIFMADTANLVSAGKQYTISFEAKQNGNIAPAEVYYYGNNYQTTGYITKRFFSPTTTWQKFSHTFTITSGAELINQRIRFDNNGTITEGENAILYIRNVKLEEGGIATPFCYSVKDTIGDTGAPGTKNILF